MATTIQFKRGQKAGIPTLAAGEPGWVTDENRLYIGTGSGNVALPISGDTAGSATKATQDSAGQQINKTYIKALSASGKTVTYTKGDGTTGTFTTQDTTYTAATASKAGLMSASDKQKLDGVGAGAAAVKITAVTLAADGWTFGSADGSATGLQQVSVAGIVADETKQLIQAAPKAASLAAYEEAGVRPYAQGAGTLLFKYDSAPGAALDVLVAVQEANG